MVGPDPSRAGGPLDRGIVCRFANELVLPYVYNELRKYASIPRGFDNAPVGFRHPGRLPDRM